MRTGSRHQLPRTQAFGHTAVASRLVRVKDAQTHDLVDTPQELCTFACCVWPTRPQTSEDAGRDVPTVAYTLEALLSEEIMQLVPGDMITIAALGGLTLRVIGRPLNVTTSHRLVRLQALASETTGVADGA